MLWSFHTHNCHLLSMLRHHLMGGEGRRGEREGRGGEGRGEGRVQGGEGRGGEGRGGEREGRRGEGRGEVYIVRVLCVVSDQSRPWHS